MTSVVYPESWLRHPEWIAAEAADSHAFGVHYYADLLGCIKRAHLTGDADGSADADFGTHVHAWLHQYHTSGNATTLMLSAERPAKSCSEVELASRYAARFPAHSLGRIVLAETRLRGSIMLNDREYPMAGTVDAVSIIDDNAAWTFGETHNGVSIEPGVYLNDFKTSKAKGELTIPRHLNGEQAPFYVELIRQTHPELYAQMRGVMFHILYRYIQDREDASQFQTINVGMPDEMAMNRVKGLIVDGTARLEQYGKDHMSPGRCYDYNRACPAFMLCDRSNFVDTTAAPCETV